MSPKACVKCGIGIQDPVTGRPRVYCGEPCKRAASYEITRLSRLIFRLESWALDVRLQRERWDLYESKARTRELVKLQKEIDAAEARMRLLFEGIATNSEVNK